MWYTILGAIGMYTVLTGMIVYMFGWYFKMKFIKVLDKLPVSYSIVAWVSISITLCSLAAYCLAYHDASEARKLELGVDALYNITGVLLAFPMAMTVVLLALTYRDKFINNKDDHEA